MQGTELVRHKIVMRQNKYSLFVLSKGQHNTKLNDKIVILEYDRYIQAIKDSMEIENVTNNEKYTIFDDAHD